MKNYVRLPIFDKMNSKKQRHKNKRYFNDNQEVKQFNKKIKLENILIKDE